MKQAPDKIYKISPREVKENEKTDNLIQRSDITQFPGPASFCGISSRTILKRLSALST